ncbi:DUF2752 domain-containing protein [Gordonia asplenii]|uniref:DUF2752 domain-containing protein n=1 Tax=Gordonia asplenii TaxID=2725283 RepID=UPI0028B05182|nr:DUF2752 domain-containing protein [Gordonia asplenii]
MDPHELEVIESPRRPLIAALPAAAVAAGGVAVYGIALAWSPAAVVSGPGFCPFREMTGWPCPACGLTRSFVMLAHGDVARAFSFNLFGPVFFVVGLAATIVAGWSLVARRPAVLEKFGSWLTTPAAMVLLAVWMAYGVARIVDAARGTGLFPSVT